MSGVLSVLHLTQDSQRLQGAQIGRSLACVDESAPFEMKILDLLSTSDDSKSDATGRLGQVGLIFSVIAPRDRCDNADIGGNAYVFQSKKETC